MVPRAWVLALLVLPLSGCTGSGDGRDEPVVVQVDDEGRQGPKAGMPREIPPPHPPGAWNLTAAGCTLLDATTWWPYEEARQRVPEGFVPWATTTTGYEDVASVGLMVNQCSSAQTSSGLRVSDHQEVLAFVYVMPPSEYRVPGIGNYSYRFLFAHGVASPEVRSDYASRNHTASPGSATALVEDVGGVATMLDARGTADGLAVRFRGPAPLSGSSSEYDPEDDFGSWSRMRLFAAEGARISAVDLDISAYQWHRGESTYEVEAGSFFGAPAWWANISWRDTGSQTGYTLTPIGL